MATSKSFVGIGIEVSSIISVDISRKSVVVAVEIIDIIGTVHVIVEVIIDVIEAGIVVVGDGNSVVVVVDSVVSGVVVV